MRLEKSYQLKDGRLLFAYRSRSEKYGELTTLYLMPPGSERPPRSNMIKKYLAMSVTQSWGRSVNMTGRVYRDLGLTPSDIGAPLKKCMWFECIGGDHNRPPITFRVDRAAYNQEKYEADPIGWLLSVMTSNQKRKFYLSMCGYDRNMCKCNVRKVRIKHLP